MNSLFRRSISIQIVLVFDRGILRSFVCEPRRIRIKTKYKIQYKLYNVMYKLMLDVQVKLYVVFKSLRYALFTI